MGKTWCFCRVGRRCGGIARQASLNVGGMNLKVVHRWLWETLGTWGLLEETKDVGYSVEGFQEENTSNLLQSYPQFTPFIHKKQGVYPQNKRVCAVSLQD